jgi:hypothetical protein
MPPLDRAKRKKEATGNSSSSESESS